MSHVAKVIEILSTSDESFEDAITSGVAKAAETIQGIKGAWIKEQQVVVTDGKVTGYRVAMSITFVVKD